MRKDVFLSATVDHDAARILAVLAEREAEGNKSQMLRRVIREAGERRGVWPAIEPAKREVNYGKVA